MKTGVGLLLLSASLLACGRGEPPPAMEAASPAVAQDAVAASGIDACAGMDLQLTPARRVAYAGHVVSAVDGKVAAADVQTSRFVGDGDWSLVHAAIPIADPGYFLFETVDGATVSRGVWAGFAEEGDRSGLIDWATSRGAPEAFARCFAQTVLD